MVNEITQPNPVIKHKQMTGALHVAKFTDKTSQVKVVECIGDTEKILVTALLPSKLKVEKNQS
jgi:hypothetical protein